jgi:tetratricopeptide (TPR) repeat protein
LGVDRFQEAEQQFLVVLQDRPDKQLTIYNLAQTYMAMEDWPRAIEQYQKAQNLFAAGSPMQARLLYELGVAFETIARNEDALQAYRDSAAISENIDKTDAIERVQERIRRAKGKKGGGR